MSLLEAVANVADEAGYEVDPAEVIDSDDITTTQLKAIANRIVEEMSEEYMWPQLWKSGTVTLVAGTSTYALAGDFSYYHYDTFWNQSVGWRAWGPMSPQEYAEYQGFDVDPLLDHFAIRGITNNQLLIQPTPGGSGDIIIYEYASNRYVRPRTWAMGQTVAVGDYAFYNGNYYVSQTAGATGATAPTHTSSTASDGTITWEYYSGAYKKFIADTDEPVISQRLLEQGMLERFAEIKGLKGVVPKYETQLRIEFGKAIPGKTLFADGGARNRIQFARNERVIFGG